MQTRPTTPFGRRPLSLAMVAREAEIENFTASAAAGETIVHKWRLFRALTEAKAPLGVTDRALSVLHALLSFHQETALTTASDDRGSSDEESGGGSGLVVFPSNKELSIRAHGMAPATLRRHLACLVDAGLIIRRDSPNGKRFARKGQGGAIEEAFGFDLTPLVARAAEIDNLAEEVRAENRAIALLREQITLTRRDVAKMIETGLEERVPGDWEELHLRYAALSGRYARRLPRPDLEALASDLATLAAEIRKSLEAHVKTHNMSGNESRSERHIQNQTTNNFDLEPRLREGRPDPTASSPERDGASVPRNGVAVSVETPRRLPGPPPRAYPLGMVLQACPDIVDYAKGGEIASWRDLSSAAATARSALGVSLDAWSQALEVLGEHDAAIVIAAILQRGDEIRSAGGYLRVLTEKARAGEFSLGPVLMALLRGEAARNARARKATG
jgi:replication initiation protein RepC